MANCIYGRHHNPHQGWRICRITPQKGLQGSWSTKRKRLIPTSLKVHLRIEGDQFSRHRRILWSSIKGHKETCKCSRLATSQGCSRSQKIPRLHRILLTLRSRILRHYMTTAWTHQKGCLLALGTWAIKGIWRAKDTHVHQAYPTTAKFQQEVLCSDRCIQSWHGRHTLARRWRTS